MRLLSFFGLVLVFFLTSPSTGLSQGAINSATVLNPSVNECEEVEIHIQGWLAYTPATLNNVSYSVNGNQITVNAHFNASMLAALDDFDEVLTFGPVPAGSYTVEVVGMVVNTPFNVTTLPLTVQAGENNSANFDAPFNGMTLEFCPGKELTLDALNPGNTYEWSTGESGQTITVKDEGLYEVTIKDADCAMLTDYVMVDFYNVPDLNLPNNVVVCPVDGKTVTLDVPGWTSYNWTPGNYTGSAITISSAGAYVLNVTDENGCEAESVVNAKETCSPSFFAPTAFTPNGDGDNDVFLPTVNDVSNYSLKVYNRWGQMIFESTNVAVGWDGTSDGEYVPYGSYVWVIEYEPASRNGYESSNQFHYGSVVLLR